MGEYVKVSDIQGLLADSVEVIIADGGIWSEVVYFGSAEKIPEDILQRDVFQIIPIPGVNMKFPGIKIYLYQE